MREFLLGLTIGLALGTAMAAGAQCCAQFDVPFNQQLEQEHWQTLRDADRAVEEFDGLLPYQRPCAR